MRNSILERFRETRFAMLAAKSVQAGAPCFHHGSLNARGARNIAMFQFRCEKMAIVLDAITAFIN